MNENTKHHIDLLETTKSFSPISLTQMDQVKLLNRQDTKLVIPVKQMNTLLEVLAPDYYMLEVANKRISAYTSLYYDTVDWESYSEHHNGHKNRYKVRYRNYVDSDLSFFEIKFKSNKNRTVKTRIRVPQEHIVTELGAEEIELLRATTPLDPALLFPMVWVYYKRMTLVSKDLSERVTVDLEIGFHRFGEQAEPIIHSPDLAIIEIKQERFNRKSIALRTLHDEKIFPIRLSKYCLGVMSCYDGQIKKNSFKAKLLRIAKITNNDFYRSIAVC